VLVVVAAALVLLRERWRSIKSLLSVAFLTNARAEDGEAGVGVVVAEGDAAGDVNDDDGDDGNDGFRTDNCDLQGMDNEEDDEDEDGDDNGDDKGEVMATDLD